MGQLIADDGRVSDDYSFSASGELRPTAAMCRPSGWFLQWHSPDAAAPGGGWTDLYYVDSKQCVAPADFELLHWAVCTQPGHGFRARRMACLHLADGGRVALLGSELRVYEPPGNGSSEDAGAADSEAAGGGAVHVSLLADDAELAVAVRQHFGIDVPSL